MGRLSAELDQSKRWRQLMARWVDLSLELSREISQVYHENRILEKDARTPIMDVKV